MSEGIRITVALSQPPEKIWQALTDQDRFKQWFTSCQSMELALEPGGKAVFSGGSDDGAYVSDGIVLDCIPEKKLFHTILEGHEPLWYGSLLWRMEPTDTGSRLTLAESGFQAREEDMGDIEEGWRALLLSLCRFLEDNDAPALPEETYETGGLTTASATGYSYSDKAACWERLMLLHDNPAPKPLSPCTLIGDLAPAGKGMVLDVIPEQKLMLTWPEAQWQSMACWTLEDMGTETKISLERWGFEEREEALTEAQTACDTLMDRIIAGLDAASPESPEES